jgi:uncharacterized membrane protein YqjE
MPVTSNRQTGEVTVTLLARDQNGHAPETAETTDAAAPAASAADKSVGQLTAQLGEQVSRLVRDELALAQTEAKQRAKRVGLGLGTFGFAGLLAFFGACCLVAAAVLGLSNVLRPWFAALIVAGALLFLALLVVLPGWKGITERRPAVPQDSVESVRADLAAVRQAMHHQLPAGQDNRPQSEAHRGGAHRARSEA